MQLGNKIRFHTSQLYCHSITGPSSSIIGDITTIGTNIGHLNVSQNTGWSSCCIARASVSNVVHVIRGISPQYGAGNDDIISNTDKNVSSIDLYFRNNCIIEFRESRSLIIDLCKSPLTCIVMKALLLATARSSELVPIQVYTPS